jgi:hypothetical protein
MPSPRPLRRRPPSPAPRPRRTSIGRRGSVECAHAGIDVPTLESMLATRFRQEIETEWDNMLGHQLPRPLPPFADFWAALEEVFGWLDGTRPALCGVCPGGCGQGEVNGRSKARLGFRHLRIPAKGTVGCHARVTRDPYPHSWTVFCCRLRCCHHIGRVPMYSDGVGGD